MTALPCVPRGTAESAGSAYSPSIIQEPELDKARHNRAPHSGEHRGSGHHNAHPGLHSTPPGARRSQVLWERGILLPQTAASPAWQGRMFPR